MAELARAGATPGARAKAADFVIERLAASRDKLGEAEKTKHELELELGRLPRALGWGYLDPDPDPNSAPNFDPDLNPNPNSNP